MKRLFSLCLAALLCLSVFNAPLTIHASDNTNIASADVSILDVADIWIAVRDSGKLLVNESGMLYVDDNEYTSNPAYEDFLNVVEQCNISISEGIIRASESGCVELLAKEGSTLNDKLSDLYASYDLSNFDVEFNENESDLGSTGATIHSIVPPNLDDFGGGHSCHRLDIDLLEICESNYQSLVIFYEGMRIVEIADPTFDAWAATVALWINRVREDGIWDYKVSSVYGPYNNPLCSYYNGAYHHFTAEYFGNLNYGYTGSFLFGLDMLHFGSYAVSGFDAKDVEDWPAIDEGYYLKTG